MIESEGIAPYAPAPAVVGVIRAYRERPLPTPIDATVVEKIGIAPSIVPRTLQALKLIDLLDAEGNPTAALQDLRKAGSDEYHARLAEVVRAAYPDVFTYRDPATDDIAKIEDAFRGYQPVSMRPRMVRLFMGLCQEAGIVEAAPKVTKATDGRADGQRARTSSHAASSSSRSRGGSGSSNVQHASSPSPLRPDPTITAGADHLAVRGLLLTLPPVGDVFPDEKRKEWADAMLAAFNLIYLRASETPTTRTRVSSAEGGESDS
ncbi:MAG TPA: DUF5343 domain-containing protein [Gaiellaceae bacterium]|nr:DUF5343 domain-containing protein [Gaiellaceae bacterium]